MDSDEIVKELTETLECGPGEILAKAQKLIDENQKLKDKIEALKNFVNECTTFRG